MGGNVYNSGDVYIRAVVGQDGHLERGVKGDLRDIPNIPARPDAC